MAVPLSNIKVYSVSDCNVFSFCGRFILKMYTILNYTKYETGRCRVFVTAYKLRYVISNNVTF